MLPRYLKFALKSSVSVAKSAQKKHEMIGWTPQIDCHSLLSTIMQNKKLQIVLCHKRIISSKFKIFKKNHTPKTQLMHSIANIAQVIVDFWNFLYQDQKFFSTRDRKTKEVMCVWSISFDYTPFHGCFLCGCIFLSGCHILIENSAIFITKMQWILWKKFDCNFWTQTRKNFQNNTKCYTTSIFILSQQKIFKGLF